MFTGQWLTHSILNCYRCCCMSLVQLYSSTVFPTTSTEKVFKKKLLVILKRVSLKLYGIKTFEGKMSLKLCVVTLSWSDFTSWFGSEIARHPSEFAGLQGAWLQSERKVLSGRGHSGYLLRHLEREGEREGVCSPRSIQW